MTSGVGLAAIGPVLLGAMLAQAPVTALDRAEAAWADGERQTAAHEYAAALAADPRCSRAAFRLGQLTSGGEAVGWFERYVALEPRDAWGHMALGDALAKTGQAEPALAAYEVALRLRPQERDGQVGLARVLARVSRLDQAIERYEAWLAGHPEDVEVWRELAASQRKAGRLAEALDAWQRVVELSADERSAQGLKKAQALAAAVIEPIVGGSRDSESNAVDIFGFRLETGQIGRGRYGVAAERHLVTDASLERRIDMAEIGGHWRPRSTVDLRASVGLASLAEGPPGLTPAPRPTRITGPGGRPLLTTPTVPTPGERSGSFGIGSLRLRWRPRGAGGPLFDLRGRRTLLDGSTLLLADRIVRNDLSLLAEWPVAFGVGLRGMAKGGTLRGDILRNDRHEWAAGLRARLGPAAEVSLRYRQAGYDQPGGDAFFAPRLDELVEAGSYFEIDRDGPLYAAFDVGAGLQRLALHGEASGSWEPALRLWSLVGVRLAPGRELRLEADLFDGQAASESATTAGWRWAKVSLSLHWSTR